MGGHLLGVKCPYHNSTGIIIELFIKEKQVIERTAKFPREFKLLKNCHPYQKKLICPIFYGEDWLARFTIDFAFSVLNDVISLESEFRKKEFSEGFFKNTESYNYPGNVNLQSSVKTKMN